MPHQVRSDPQEGRAGPGAARVGIGGPVGSGKTALIEALIPVLQRRRIDFAVVTNDLVTREDAKRLRRSGLIDPARSATAALGGTAVLAGALLTLASPIPAPLAAERGSPDHW